MSDLVVPSPVGWLRLIADTKALLAIERATANSLPKESSHPMLKAAAKQLEEFFVGKRTTFTLPLAPAPTAFQEKVRRALLQIPFGQTTTYAALAKVVGSRSPRAVGQAVGANSLLVIVPCHRVVAKAGPGGFAWGLPAKRRLLAAEAR